MVMDFFERFCYTFAISSKNDIFKEGYPMLTINETRLLNRIHELGAVGIDADGRPPPLPPPMRTRQGAISCPAGCARQDSPS